MLKLRKEEADGESIKNPDEQFRELTAVFKKYPGYREAAEVAEAHWGEKTD